MRRRVAFRSWGIRCFAWRGASCRSFRLWLLPANPYSLWTLQLTNLVVSPTRSYQGLLKRTSRASCAFAPFVRLVWGCSQESASHLSMLCGVFQQALWDVPTFLSWHPLTSMHSSPASHQALATTCPSSFGKHWSSEHLRGPRAFKLRLSGQWVSWL